MPERVKTGIKGLDSLIGGGFEKGSVVEVSGGEGSFKSIFGLQFAIEGVKKGEKVMYFSFEEPRKSFEQTAKCFSWYKSFSRIDFRQVDVKKMIENNGASFNASGSEKLAEKMIRAVDGGVERLVFDSATTLALYSSRTAIKPSGERAWSFVKPSAGDIRLMLYYLASELRKTNATVLFLAESGTGELYLAEEVLKYVCDAKIELKKSSLGTQSPRTIIIHKMRHTNHPLDEMALNFTASGLEVKALGKWHA